MNVSKHEQRVLHALAQGGHITFQKNNKGKIVEILCVNRDGWVLSDCTLGIFQKLRRRGLIASHDSQPYRITRDGLAAVRPQLDNR
ncbi:YjhX family toxin [Dongia deserti]|uniref:YjhX family toxin n=1 Tax=Dongia deserti TaxID=2268030 RepID=UPI000E659157|nr:YjhX family toxin [Dongia deserti]